MATQNTIYSNNPDREKMEEIVKKTVDILLHVRSVFPFDFFPDDIIIDKNKITIIHRLFFFTGQSHSIPIPEVGDIVVESGPLFASLSVYHKRLPNAPVTVRYLSKRNAKNVQELIQGLVLAQTQEIDTSHLEAEELVYKAKKSGRVVLSI